MTRPHVIQPHTGSRMMLAILAADPDVSIEQLGATLLALTIGEAAALELELDDAANRDAAQLATQEEGRARGQPERHKARLLRPSSP